MSDTLETFPHVDISTELGTPAPPTDYEALYAEQRAENQRLLDVMAASRINTTHPNQNRSVQAPVSAERVRRLLGPSTLLKMTRNEKLTALGVDPASISDDGLRKVFGRGCDSAVGADLFKTSPARYAQLKEASLLLNLYGA